MECPKCGSKNTGNSPCGFHCNDCKYADPCPCWQGRRDKCEWQILNNFKEEC